MPRPLSSPSLRLLLPALAALLGCQGGPARGPNDPIVLGVAWPWQARQGLRFEDGLTLAIEETNAAGGVLGRPLSLRRVDDEESVDAGRLAAQALAADPEVTAVIGHLQSYVAVPAAAIYDLAGKVLLAPAATDPRLTALGYPRVFRATFTDRVVGETLASYARAQGYRRIAICYIRNTYGRNLANAFEEDAIAHGLQIVARQSYDPSDQVSERTFSEMVADWRHEPLDAVFLAGETPSAGHFLVEARRQGLQVPVLGGDALSSPELLQVAGADAEGVVVATIFHPDDPRPEVRRFTDAFRRRFGIAPDPGAAIGYDAVRLLADAMTRAGSVDPAPLATALHATRDFTGVTGTFTFGPDGDLIGKAPVIVQVRQGEFAFRGAPAPGAQMAAR